ncbi:MAG: hypothetical protein DRP87_01645 [Spirochaetes bacterium]|nr:MAG: hypothetical protein DRP87_01645 [Spirochaetota bacterium]
MFGIGFWEIIIILILIIIFINPRDLPGIFRKIGRFYKQITGFYNDMLKIVDEMEKNIKLSSIEKVGSNLESKESGNTEKNPSASNESESKESDHKPPSSYESDSNKTG